MSKLKHFLILIAVAILIAGFAIGSALYVLSFLGIAELSSKVIYFNALFFMAIGWWYSLVNKANELKKFESSLSPTHEIFLALTIEKMSRTIWAIINFNFFSVFVTFMAFLVGNKFTVANLAFLSVYFFTCAFLLLLLSAPIKNRIESANVLLNKKEKEEKKREEIIKSLKSGLDKFDKDKHFEGYNIVANGKNGNRK